MENKKKMAAAISAVLHYVKTEEEILAQQMIAVQTGETVPSRKAPSAPASVPLRLWGINGRQTQMQIRHLMQMKTFHGVKFR